MVNYMRGDFDQIIFKHEQPTWQTASGAAIWPNQVQKFALDEKEGVIKTFYAGAGTRDVAQFNRGPIEAKFKLPFNIQNGQLLWQAFGSEVFVSGTTSTHTIVATSGALPSETFEIFKGGGVANANLVRTLNGCTADTLSITGEMGKIITGDVEFIPGSVVTASGAATAITSVTTVPYRWDMAQSLISGGGFNGILQELAKFQFLLNNNLEKNTYYLNLSRYRGQPVPQQRLYEFNVKMNATAGSTTQNYANLFRGGSTANIDMFLFRTSGTDQLQLWMSGCTIDPMSVPIVVQGKTEYDMKFLPATAGIIIKDAIGTAYSA